VNVTLAPAAKAFIHAKLQSGRYRSASELVNTALGMLQAHEVSQEQKIEPLHARVDDALLSLTRGEGEEGESYVEDLDGGLEESQEDERPVQR